MCDWPIKGHRSSLNWTTKRRKCKFNGCWRKSSLTDNGTAGLTGRNDGSLIDGNQKDNVGLLSVFLEKLIRGFCDYFSWSSCEKCSYIQSWVSRRFDELLP